MTNRIRSIFSLLLAVVGSLCGLVRRAEGQASDQAAALLVYPYVAVDSARGIDTSIYISNAATDAGVAVRCFLLYGGGYCSNDGEPCDRPEDCANAATCDQRFLENDFTVRMTPGQPLGWSASTGRTEFPCVPPRSCPGSNEDSRVPPIPT